jgi:hypothetical protein
MSTQIEHDLSEEQVVTRGAKPAEKSGLSNEAEVIGGPDVKTTKPTDKESTGKKVAAKVSKASAPTTHPSAASGKVAEETEGDEEEVLAEVEGEEVEADEAEETVEEAFKVDVEEDVNALVFGEDLSEDFKEKAKTIFEAALTSKLSEQYSIMEAAFAEVLEEEVATIKTELAEKVDGYLSYVATNWLDENKLAVDSGIKAEIGESIIQGLRNLFQEHNIDVSEEKVDLLGDAETRVEALEEKLNEQISINVELNKQLGSFVKNGIVNEISMGLSEIQKEKLAGLAEAVEFHNESDFRTKVETLKEAYFAKSASATQVEDTLTENVQLTGSMDTYVRAISRWSK